MNLISVVIPLYNKEISVSRSIKSVLNQSYSNFELIIVNDGSSDNSLNEVNKIQDERIRVFNIKNSGVSYARNFGISQSKSNFVCLLDADDEWKEGFLEEINKLINLDKNASLYSCRYEIVDETGSRNLGNLAISEDYFGKISNFYKTYANSRSLICSSCVCINKKYFLEIGGFPEGKKTGEDIYVWLTLNLKGYTCFSAKILATIYRNSENRTITRVKREIPFHLDFYLFSNYDKGNNDLNIFCIKNSMLYAIEAKKSKDIQIYKRYLNQIKNINRKYYFILLMFVFIPDFFILILQKLRNFLTLK